jgi:hypothetical protein
MENGMNGPIIALSFVAGMSFSGLLTSLVAAILVGVIAKGFDRLTKFLIAERSNHWRRVAKSNETRVRELEARVHELTGKQAE